MDNSPKNDRLSSTEPCALYYFPEIPSATSRQNQTAKPGRFTSGSFKCSDDQASQKGTNQDAEQIQALIEEAFNKGLEQGRVETKVVQEEQVNNAVAALEAGIQEIHRVRRHDVERMETETVRLALAITKKVIGYETEHHAVVQHVVKQAMEKVNDTRSFTLKLNPRDLDAVKDLHNDLLPADDLGVVFRIEADEAIKRGGCVIETKLGDIDARIDRQIKIIEELLIDQVPKSTAQE